jgi:two-component system copper resistance phosphate regulon response regulator CusR
MRILVVEDEKKIARFIERGLREEGMAVDVAHDGAEGLTRALETRYDVIILDVLLPAQDGFSVLAELRAARCRSRVLMLTALDSVRDRVRGLETGADDYLGKPFAFVELLARVRALARRDADEPPAVLRCADLELDLHERKARRAGKSIPLSTREFSVLAHLLRHANRVISRTLLAEAVWDENYDPLSNVIDVTVYHLREKVDRGFHPALIHTVRGAGYVLRPPES